MRIAVELLLSDLPQDQANTLKDLLEKVDFSGLPEHLKSSAAIPDEFTYSITVESHDWHHTVVRGDSSADEKMRELLELLAKLARSQMRKH